jgi:hypothetical protein
MESRTPLPTDNIYKFYALFGLVLFLASIFAFLNIHNSYNERAFARYIETETLNGLSDLNLEQQLRKNVLDTQEKLDSSDKNFYLHVLGGALAIAMLLMAYGFYSWHTKIQPMQDELARRQLAKLGMEIDSLRRTRRVIRK